MAALRRYVSGTRRRFVNENFDLDLTYVTDRIIVMGFPAVGMEAFYRNPRKKVLKFLRETHANQYLVFNLCHEEKHQYDPEIFAHAKNPPGAIPVPFEDHSVPRLKQIALLVYKAIEWLESDDSNVVVIHCKAGKGRSGLMCCALLVAFHGMTPDEALRLFAEKRSVKNEGVTINSQEKWVRMFADFIPKVSEYAGPKRQMEAMLELTTKQITRRRKLMEISINMLPLGNKFNITLERRNVDEDRAKHKAFPVEWTKMDFPNLTLDVKEDVNIEQDFALFLSIDRGLELRAWFCLELPENNDAHGELTLTCTASEIDTPPDVLHPDFIIRLTLSAPT